MAILTLGDFKNLSNINNTKNDEVFSALIEAANEYIPLYCNTSFEDIVLTDVRPSLFYDTTVILPHAPIISVESVVLINADKTETTLVSTDYLVDKEEGCIDLVDYVGILPTTPRSYKVSYTHGHEQIPATIQWAAMEFVKYYEKREFNKQKSIGNGQTVDYTPSELLPAHIRTLLDGFKVL